MRSVRWFCACACACLAVACSAGVEDAVLDITFDPCDALIVDAAGDATTDESESVDVAIEMWNSIAATRLTRDPTGGTPRVRIRFDDAAEVFHGVYDDERGEIVVNRALDGTRERAVTIAHELGHAFGLWHVDASERASVMNRGNLDTEPNAGDVDALYRLWGDCRQRRAVETVGENFSRSR